MKKEKTSSNNTRGHSVWEGKNAANSSSWLLRTILRRASSTENGLLNLAGGAGTRRPHACADYALLTSAMPCPPQCGHVADVGTALWQVGETITQKGSL